MNRTILEMVKYMLFTFGLSKAFQTTATFTTVYFINRTHSLAINFKTLQEMWPEKSSDYDHLKVFGYIAYAYVKDEKLDPRAIK